MKVPKPTNNSVPPDDEKPAYERWRADAEEEARLQESDVLHNECYQAEVYDEKEHLIGALYVKTVQHMQTIGEVMQGIEKQFSAGLRYVKITEGRPVDPPAV